MSWDADEVRNAASGKWDQVLLAVCDGRVGADHLQDRHGPCPGCGGNDRFRFDDRDGSGSFICSQGGGGNLSGDGIGLVAHVLDIPWTKAVDVVGEYLIPEKNRRGKGSGKRSQAPSKNEGVKAAPKVDATGFLQFDEEKLRKFHRPDWNVDESWLADRSPIDPASITDPGEFIDHLYEPDEKVLIFSEFFSQGNFMRWVGKGSFALGSRPDQRAVRSELPKQNFEGAWFLCQPVSGKWLPFKDSMSRRFFECVTSWRYLVLEADDAPQSLWMDLLVQLPLPIAALYTSGGRSIHALVRLDAKSKHEWDEIRKVVLPLFTRLGADGGSLTAVRLTRLPGVERKVVTCPKCGLQQTAKPKGRPCKNKSCGEFLPVELSTWSEQKLLYLNPKPDPKGIPICSGGNVICSE
jgi:hypothetical protein